MVSRELSGAWTLNLSEECWKAMKHCGGQKAISRLNVHPHLQIRLVQKQRKIFNSSLKTNVIQNIHFTRVNCEVSVLIIRREREKMKRKKRKKYGPAETQILPVISPCEIDRE